jgi:hypothetical protein
MRNAVTSYFIKADHCTRCHEPLASSAYMVRNRVVVRMIGDDFHIYRKQKVPVCEACTAPAEAALCVNNKPCPGCGLGMKCDGNVRYCSERCAKRLLRQRRQHWRPKKFCAVCKTSFKPKRSDAEFCSGPCRQWAYRRRRAPSGDSFPIKSAGAAEIESILFGIED